MFKGSERGTETHIKRNIMAYTRRQRDRGAHGHTQRDIENMRNKLGLSWAKLSSSWDWTLIFCRFGFYGFSLIDLVWCKFDLVDLVCYIGFGKLGSVAS